MTDTFDQDLRDRDGERLADDWYQDKRRFRWGTQQRVGRTRLIVGDNEFTVSTVWLHGIDHTFPPYDSVPLLFETMVFGEPYANHLTRYPTEEEAMRGHLRVLDRLRAGESPFDDGEET